MAGSGLFKLSFGNINEGYRRFLRRSGGIRSKFQPTRFTQFPSIWCSKCGEWTSSGPVGRLTGRKVQALVSEGMPEVLRTSKWKPFAKSWANRLGIDPSLLHPGMPLQPPQGLGANLNPDPVVSPSLPWLWFSKPLVDEIRDAGLTGAVFHKVEWVGAKRPREDYFELEARGSVRSVRAPGAQRRCRICGRHGPIRENSRRGAFLDSWTGHDFSTYEAGYVWVVSARTVALLKRRSRNVFAEELESV